MLNPIEILTQELESLKLELAAKYNELGMRASGDFEQSLDIKVEKSDIGLSGIITGASYGQQLETGRMPGKQPPSATIEKWIIDKGIASRIEGDISVSSLAYLIARKIGREGWKREQNGGVELISKVITPERVQDIINRIGESYIAEFTNQVITQLTAA